MSVVDLHSDTTFREPVTFVERVAYALCAHDIAGGEGRMTDEELEALNYAIDIWPGGALNYNFWKRLIAFSRMEDAFRKKDGWELAHAHIIMRDWPNYIESAKAAMSVLCEKPEAALSS